jgi:hypothetical protein
MTDEVKVTRKPLKVIKPKKESKPKKPTGAEKAAALREAEREKVLKNTLKGTFYENVPIKSYKINSIMSDNIPGHEEEVDVIKNGEITFLFDETIYKIVVEDGYFTLFGQDGKDWFQGSGQYIGSRVIVRDNVYYPADTPPTIDDLEKKKKKEQTFMTGKEKAQ